MPQINEFSWMMTSMKMILLILVFLTSMNLVFSTLKMSKILYKVFYFNLII